MEIKKYERFKLIIKKELHNGERCFKIKTTLFKLGLSEKNGLVGISYTKQDKKYILHLINENDVTSIEVKDIKQLHKLLLDTEIDYLSFHKSMFAIGKNAENTFKEFSENNLKELLTY